MALNEQWVSGAACSQFTDPTLMACFPNLRYSSHHHGDVGQEPKKQPEAEKPSPDHSRTVPTSNNQLLKWQFIPKYTLSLFIQYHSISYPTCNGRYFCYFLRTSWPLFIYCLYIFYNESKLGLELSSPKIAKGIFVIHLRCLFVTDSPSIIFSVRESKQTGDVNKWWQIFLFLDK